MTVDLFVYGLLQHPEVLQPLIGWVPDMTPARLEGHVRRVLVHEDFEPCAVAVAEPGQAIEGVVLHGLNARSLAQLDVFEVVDQGIYQRAPVMVCLASGESLACEVYLRGAALADTHLGGHWNQANFQQEHMDYVLTELVPRFANY